MTGASCITSLVPSVSRGSWRPSLKGFFSQSRGTTGSLILLSLLHLLTFGGGDGECVCHYAHVEVRGPLVGIGSLLPPCGLELTVGLGRKWLYPLLHLAGPSPLILVLNHIIELSLKFLRTRHNSHLVGTLKARCHPYLASMPDKAALQHRLVSPFIGFITNLSGR